MARRDGTEARRCGAAEPRSLIDIAPVGQGLVQDSVGVFAVPLAIKPNVVEAPAPRAPFQEAFFTLAVAPLTVRVPLHTWLIDCPLARVQVTVQPLTPALPAV